MKSRLLLATLLVFAVASTAHSAIYYSGTKNIPIPLDFEGAYLQIDTGITASALPGNWDTAAWINPFFGGVDIATSALFRPIVIGLDQISNLRSGTPINSASTFTSGESGSSTHVGSGTAQFQIGVPGMIGFTFQSSPGGPSYYGWMDMVINNAGTGAITGWAYQDTPGAPILAGDIGSTPEPGTALFGICAAMIAGGRRNRRPLRSSV